MSETLVEVQNLWKKFARDDVAIRQNLRTHLWAALLGRRVSSSDTILPDKEFWALQDINFSVKRGEALGIMGHNGAGKSTLMNILSGLSKADKGDVLMHGRVVSLLNLANGLNGELTGRENIYRKAVLNGLSEDEAYASEQQIIDFAELADFIDAPYRTYSSGMQMRLAFATNINSGADIFLLDEVFGVGDGAFNKKCVNFWKEIKPNIAIIMVSHGPGQILDMCEKAILLNNGQCIAYDSSKQITQLYANSGRTKIAQTADKN